MTKPIKLKIGDTIGIVSVSAPDPMTAQDWFERGIKLLENFGYKIQLGKSTKIRHGYLSGTEDIMAEDINSFFLDPNINAIICAGGGINANRLVPLLDYEVIKGNPKIFMGVSNPSVLLNAIFSKSSLITFHGPTIVWNFGNPNGLTSYTSNNLWGILNSYNNNYKFKDQPEWQWLRNGTAEGRLIGGNLISIQSLLGTEAEPDWENTIFFWEDISKSIDRIDMMLTHFRNAGIFEKIKGMIIGQLVNCNGPEGGLDLNTALLEIIGNYTFPILTGVALGHTDDKLTLPIGCMAKLDSSKNEFSLIESPVA